MWCKGGYKHLVARGVMVLKIRHCKTRLYIFLRRRDESMLELQQYFDVNWMPTKSEYLGIYFVWSSLLLNNVELGYLRELTKRIMLQNQAIFEAWRFLMCSYKIFFFKQCEIYAAHDFVEIGLASGINFIKFAESLLNVQTINIDVQIILLNQYLR